MPPELHAVPGGINEPEDPIAVIQTKLRKYPQARYEASTNRVVVYPVDGDGFQVGFYANRGRYSVSCDGWHEEFADSTIALNCFAFALSTACRLKVWRRGSTAYRWQLQSLENGAWVGQSEVGLLFYPFWRTVEVAFLQNRLLEAA